jgi:hypothetical protein
MREQSNHISTHRFPETACECCSAFPRKAKPDTGIAGARPTLTRGFALVTLKYRRMMLAHRLHDLSRASPPTLIGGQADRGSSRGTVQRDASGYRPTERGIRSHSSRAVREHLFSAKGAIYIFKQDKRLYPGPSGEDAVPSANLAMSDRLSARVGARWDSRPGISCSAHILVRRSELL